MTHVISADSVFIFDVDGVITDPHIKVPNPQIVHFIAQQLGKKKPVGIGTGRSADWLTKNLIPLIRDQLSEGEFMDLLFLAGEKGAVTITFSQGRETVHIDEKVVIPDDIKQKIREKVQTYPTIFDNGKKTMISIEIEGGENKDKIKKEKESLDDLEKWIEKEIQPDQHHLVLERSIIALDIQQEQVNKRLVAQKFLSFLQQIDFQYKAFAIFGDSPSDTHIAEELHGQGLAVTFVYVGYQPLTHAYTFPIMQSKTLFDKGVLEVLQNIQ